MNNTKNREAYLDGLKRQIASKGITLNTEQEKALHNIAFYMTESEAEECLEHVTQVNVPALMEVVNATIGEEREAIELNGNMFLYNKGEIDISRYRNRLEQIGYKSQGNTWAIYEEDGELVIY